MRQGCVHILYGALGCLAMKFCKLFVKDCKSIDGC